MPSSDNDPSIWSEPHLRSGPFEPDPSEAKSARRLDGESRRQTADDRVEHSVWDEPGLSPELAGGAPKDGLAYRDWIAGRASGTSFLKSWSVTFAVALAAGPWAVLGAIWSGHQGFAGALAAIFVAPLTEEIMKAALPLFIVEKRPYLFRSFTQILFCGMMSGLAFATIENLLYLHVYVPEASSLLTWWRWTVCTSLHVVCTLIASAGLARIWRRTMERRQRPELSLGSPFLVAAMIVHGAYNAFAIVLEKVVSF